MNLSPSLIPPQFEQLINELKACGEVSLIGPLSKRSQPKQNHPLIAVDGGIDSIDSSTTDFWYVGDCDSLSSGQQRIKEGLGHWILPKNKAASDLAMALTLLPNTMKKVHLLGLLGGRVDHQMMVFGEVQRSLKRLSQATISFEQELQAYSAGEHQLSIEGGFSLFSLEEIELSIDGAVRYPLKPSTVFPGQSLTLSNEGHGSVCLRSSGPIFLYQFSPTLGRE